MPPVKSGPVGLGIIGGSGAFGRFIASALPLVSGVTLQGIAGTNEQRTRQAAEALGVPLWTINYRELIDHPAIDVVVVASPPHLHAEMALAALRANKGVFVEKPLATSLPAGLALLEEARRRNVPATIDYVMRYSPLYQAAKMIVETQALGALRRMEFRNDAGDEGLAGDHWFWDRARSGGIFIEHGVHFFDVYGWLAGGDPLEVHGLTVERDPTGLQDVVHADVRYANGILGIFTHAFDKPSVLESQEGLLVFDRGSLRIAGWTPMRLEFTGLVDDADRDQLAAIAGLELETVEAFPPGRTMRGRGRHFPVRHHLRGALTPTLDSQELYRRAVGAALADLIATVRDPGHRQQVTLADGLTSLAVACVAAGTADAGDLERAVASARV
jgi:predicted dehydrogenase